MGIKLREKYKGEFTEEELHQMEAIRIGHLMLGLSMSSMPDELKATFQKMLDVVIKHDGMPDHLKEKARAAGYRVDAPPADHHL